MTWVAILAALLATTPAPDDPGPLALDVLHYIVVENEHRGDDYDRSLFAPWYDHDRNGCHTRNEVLIHESLVPVTTDPDCHVLAGHWWSSYDNTTTTNPRDLQIDHHVPLKEAWDSGAWAWTDHRRDLFANDLTDPRTLRAVTSSSNQSKGDRDPSNWMPPNDDVWCEYLADWIAVKIRWNLTMDQSEWGRIRNILRDDCPDQTIAPWQEPTAA